MQIESIKILLVDDDEEFLELFVKLLKEEKGIEVISSNSPNSALKIIEKENVDFIVSDYKMSKMDGVEFLKELRSRNNLQPFILLTGKGSKELEVKAINLGITYYLEKNTNMKEVAKELHLFAQNYKKYSEVAKELEEQKVFYEQIITQTPIAFAYHKIILDEKENPIDYEFLSINPAFEENTGLRVKEVLGKKVTEVLPDIKKGEFDWIKEYGKIALKQENKQFEEYSLPLQKWYKVNVFSPKKYYFITQFLDITLDKTLSFIQSETFELVNFDEKINTIIEIIAQTLKADHTTMVLIRKESGKTQKIYDYSANKEEKVSLQIQEYVLRNIEWMNKLKRGEEIYYEQPSVSTEKDNNKEDMFEKERIKSLIVLPLVFSKEFLGFISLSFTKKETEWKVQEINFLKRVKIIISNALVKKGYDDEQKRWKLAVESANDAIWDYDVLNDYIYYSKEWGELLGYDKNEIGRTLDDFYSLVHPEDLERVKDQTLNHFPKTDSVGEIEYRIRSKDGSYKWVLSRGRVLEREKNGSVVRLTGTHTDITNIKEMQEKLQKSLEKNQSLLDAFNDLVFIISKEGVFIEYMCNNIEQLFVSPEEFMNKNIKDVLPLQISELYFERIGKISITKKSEMMEYFLDKNNERQFYEGIIVPYGEDFLVRCQNVTERKIVELEKQKIDERFRMVLDNFPNGFIFIYDRDCRFIFAEGKGLEDIELSKEEVIGKKVNEIFPSGFCNNIETQIEAAFRGEKSTLECKLQEDTFIQTVLPLKENDETVGVMGVVRNITERKLAEERILKQKEEVQRLTRYINHELNNFTPVVGGYVHLMDEEEMDVELKNEYAQMIKSQLKYIDKMMEKALDLVYAEDIIEEKEKIELNELLEEAAKMVVPTHIRVEIPASLPTIYGDYMKLLLVFKNILENAVTHGEPSYIKVSSQKLKTKEILFFENDGKIIADEEIEAIENRQTKRLGMEIVKKVVEAHRWNFKISNKGQKTTVIIEMKYPKKSKV